MSTAISWTGPLHADADELVAFDAMRLFLERYWEARGRTDDDIAVLLGALNRSVAHDGAPLDRATWSDWRQTLALMKAAGGSAQLDPLPLPASQAS